MVFTVYPGLNDTTVKKSMTSCPENLELKNARISYRKRYTNMKTEHLVAITKCNEGYELVGHFRRGCESNGRWKEVEQFCKR